MEQPLTNTLKTALHMMRQEYTFPVFEREQLDGDPLSTFNRWFAEAQKIEMEANAMMLSTANKAGKPSSRMVLLKEVSLGGLVFFGNFESRKMQEIAENPYAALLFYWEKEKRQVRFEGQCSKITDNESDEYFLTRPYGSQIGAWASAQSRPLDSRQSLEATVRDFEALYPKGQVPRPPHWGGMRLIPSLVEFWQGRISRLHDRFTYTRNNNGDWVITRLNP